MRSVCIGGLTFTVALLSACASTPPVEVRYALPRADVVVTAVRTVSCTKQNAPMILNTVTTKAVYAPDADEWKSLKVRDLGGPMVNSDVGFTFAEDGRLTGLNSTQTGQGSEIIQAALALGAKVAALLGDVPSAARAQACADLAANFKDGVTSLTFTHLQSFNPKDDDLYERTEIKVIPSDQEKYDLIRALLGSVCLQAYDPKPVASPIKYASGTRRDIMLQLRQPAAVSIEVQETNDVDCQGDAAKIWAGTVFVPQLGTPYALPIPEGAIFGKQTFKLTLADSGAITALGYGRDSGAAAALGTVTKAITTAEGSTNAERAAELKAQADIILQQERLMRCERDAKACT
jgi:hypothetical protein